MVVGAEQHLHAGRGEVVETIAQIALQHSGVLGAGEVAVQAGGDAVAVRARVELARSCAVGYGEGLLGAVSLGDDDSQVAHR